MKDERKWTTSTVLIPRCGYRVTVYCEGEVQGCWGDFPSDVKAHRFGKSMIRRLRPITPPGTEKRQIHTTA